MASLDQEVPEATYFATFEKYGEFCTIQQSCMKLDLFGSPSEEEDKQEYISFKKLSDILDEYQEQSYLLDPYLENMVTPVVNCLRSYAKISVTRRKQGSSTRVERLTTLLYWYVKCRGCKTIIRFFPHEITDLSIALDFLLAPDGLIQAPSQWPLRYIVLIWLSLICMVPFDLVQFDDDGKAGHTADVLELAAKSFMSKAGLEREGAALLLSRLYARQDTNSRFRPFLEWSRTCLEDGKTDIFTSIGALQTLCEVVNLFSVEQVRPHVTQLMAAATTIEQTKILAGNTTVRKLRTKLVSRIALRLQPASLHHGRPKGIGRVLGGHSVLTEYPRDDRVIDVPEEVEDVLGQLLNALPDKDTVVRWSAAKGIARISERLPVDFADQILETILGLFSIHTITAASLYDLPAIAESTWHGASLACAELARRGLVVGERLPQMIELLSKALYFDLRKGAHSIGSNVRDAAAYALWALARTQKPSTLAPHAQRLAQCLITVALFDREIHIRRAASAAFQEHVGRNSLFPHGIDVLGKSDFYAVGIRRNAILTAAPLVAKHLEYRTFLLDHILDVTLRHWDPVMRDLGSQSLRLICQEDLPTLSSKAITKANRLLESPDVSDLHGGLLALSEIAIAYRGVDEPTTSREAHLREIFKSLGYVPFEVLVGSRNTILTAAACRFISLSLTLLETNSEATSVPQWRKIVDHGLKHRSPTVHEAAAEAMASMSRFYTNLFVDTLIRELRTSSPMIQQSLGTLLGAIDYSVHDNALPEAIECLLNFLKPTSPPKTNVEARRSCYYAIPRILSTVSANIPIYISAQIVNSLFDTLLNGLEDYSTDERGDVGSWIRVACIRSLTTFSEILMRRASSLQPFDTYLPPPKFHCAIAGILKQGVERLDNVRQEAGECFIRLLHLPLPTVQYSSLWQLPGMPLLQELFGQEQVGWNEASWLFPKAIRLLEVPEYRVPVLKGFIMSIGSKTDSTQRPLATSLVSYVKSLPLTDEQGGFDVNRLVDTLVSEVKTHVTHNAIVLPVLQTLNILLEGDALTQFCCDPRGVISLQHLVSMITRNVPRLKSVPRIHESMRIIVNLLAVEPLLKTCVPKLADFLGHDYPSVRSNSAEYLYLFLQGADIGRDTEQIEEVLLETQWSSTEGQIFKGAADRVVSLFSSTD